MKSALASSSVSRSPADHTFQRWPLREPLRFDFCRATSEAPERLPCALSQYLRPVHLPRSTARDYSCVVRVRESRPPAEVPMGAANRRCRVEEAVRISRRGRPTTCAFVATGKPDSGAAKL